jgi:ribosome-associated protein
MPEPDDAAVASKSARKRAHKALQDLAGALVTLAPGEIRALPVGEELVDILLIARDMRASSARVRQLRYAARLLADEDADALRALLERKDAPVRAEAERQHRLEALRDQLLDGGAEALRAVLTGHPQLPAGELRHAVNEARAERDTGRPRGARRALYRLLARHLSD